MKQTKAEKSVKLREQFKEDVKALGADDYMCNLLCLLLNEAYRTRHHFRIGNGVVLTHYGNGIEMALRSYYFHIHFSENDDENDDNYFAFWDKVSLLFTKALDKGYQI